MNYTDITQYDVNELIKLADKLWEIALEFGKDSHPYDNRPFVLCEMSEKIRNVGNALSLWFIEKQ